MRLFKLLILGMTTLLCALGLELGVRWIFPFYNPSTQIPFHAGEDGVTLGFSNQTSRQKTPKGDFDITVSFNRLGLRDTKDLAQSTSNDVFVAGDSFSIGWGVEEAERYSNMLEKQLGLPVYNVAIPEDIRGYIATVAYARKHGAAIRHLIIGLCMENDLWDYSQPASTHQTYAQQMNPGRMRRVYNWFKGHSALWICASHLIQRTEPGRRLFEELGVAKNIEALTHRNEDNPKIPVATRDELLKLATNYHSVVLVIPSRGLWHGQNMKVEEKTHHEMVTLLREAGVKVLDLKPVFEKAGHPLQFYFTSDPHWNRAGHKAAADALRQFLPEQPEWREVLARAPR